MVSDGNTPKPSGVLSSNMEVESGSLMDSALKVEPTNQIEDEENLFELEIKNLDTNEVFKMQIPIG